MSAKRASGLRPVDPESRGDVTQAAVCFAARLHLAQAAQRRCSRPPVRQWCPGRAQRAGGSKAPLGPAALRGRKGGGGRGTAAAAQPCGLHRRGQRGPAVLE